MTGTASGSEGEPATTAGAGEAGSPPPKKAVYKVPEVTKRRPASAPSTSQHPQEPRPPQIPQNPRPPQPRQDPPRPPAAPWPPARKQPRPRTGSTWPRNLAYAVAAGIIAGLVSGVPKLLDHYRSTGSATVPFDGRIPGLASGSATTSKVYAHPDDRYFDGSPSFGWANGAEGITAPRAAQVGGFSAQTVADAYDGARKLLIAADLDPAVLMGGDPKTYFALVDPVTKTRARYDAAVAKPSRSSGTPLSWITRFDPKRTQLVGHTVKTQGSMTATTDSAGALHVVADYRFVYAVAPVGGDPGKTRLAMVHRMVEIAVYPAADRYQLTPGTYWLYTVRVETANDLCTIDDGYLNPSFTGVPYQPGKLVDPYAGTLPTPPDPSGASASPSSASGEGCRSVTRV